MSNNFTIFPVLPAAHKPEPHSGDRHSLVQSHTRVPAQNHASAFQGEAE